MSMGDHQLQQCASAFDSSEILKLWTELTGLHIQQACEVMQVCLVCHKSCRRCLRLTLVLAATDER